MNRQRFMVNLIRVVFAGVMAAVAGMLLVRSQVENGSCPSGSMCAGCGRLNECALPEAIKHKENEKG